MQAKRQAPRGRGRGVALRNFSQTCEILSINIQLVLPRTTLTVSRLSTSMLFGAWSILSSYSEFIVRASISVDIVILNCRTFRVVMTFTPNWECLIEICIVDTNSNLSALWPRGATLEAGLTLLFILPVYAHQIGRQHVSHSNHGHGSKTIAVYALQGKLQVATAIDRNYFHTFPFRQADLSPRVRFSNLQWYDVYFPFLHLLPDFIFI